MQAPSTLDKPRNDGSSLLAVVALIAAVVALVIASMAWWHSGAPWGMMAATSAPRSDGSGYGYGPGMMPQGGPGFGFGMMGRGMMGYSSMAQPETIANALGITADQLALAEREGKSIATLANDRGVDLQKVIDTVLAPHKAAMAAMATANHMTQEQIDLMSKVMEAQLRAQFSGNVYSGSGYSFGYGPGHGPGMMAPNYGAGSGSR